MDINKFDKRFCNNITGGFNKEIFLFALFSDSENPDVYALTPAHSKRLLMWLSTQIATYEQKFGEIDTNIPSPIVSPIQPEDLPPKS